MIDRAEQLHDRVAIAKTRFTLGATLYYAGELEAAHQQGEDLRRLSDAEVSPLASVFGISSCCLLAFTGLSGQTAAARAMIREGVERCGPRRAVLSPRRRTSRRASAPCATPPVRACWRRKRRGSREYGFTVFRIKRQSSWAGATSWTDVSRWDRSVAGGASRVRGHPTAHQRHHVQRALARATWRTATLTGRSGGARRGTRGRRRARHRSRAVSIAGRVPAATRGEANPEG